MRILRTLEIALKVHWKFIELVSGYSLSSSLTKSILLIVFICFWYCGISLGSQNTNYSFGKDSWISSKIILCYVWFQLWEKVCTLTKKVRQAKAVQEPENVIDNVQFEKSTKAHWNTLLNWKFNCYVIWLIYRILTWLLNDQMAAYNWLKINRIALGFLNSFRCFNDITSTISKLADKSFSETRSALSTTTFASKF